MGVFNVATHAVNEFALPKNNSGPGGIVSAGGLLWFTEATAFSQSTAPGSHGSITSIDPTTHAIVQHPVTYTPTQLTVGPDGDLWFGESGYLPNVGQKSFVGQFNPATGALVSETQVNVAPVDALTTGPDGLVWFTAGRAIGEIDPATKAVALDPTPNAPTINYNPYGAVAITTGPDHNLWVTAGAATPAIGAVLKATIVPPDQAAITGMVAENYAGLGSSMIVNLPGVTVYVDANHDGTFDAGDPSAITDASRHVPDYRPDARHLRLPHRLPGQHHDPAVRRRPDRHPGHGRPARHPHDVRRRAGLGDPAADVLRQPVRPEQPGRLDGRGRRPLQDPLRPRPRPDGPDQRRLVPQGRRLDPDARADPRERARV